MGLAVMIGLEALASKILANTSNPMNWSLWTWWLGHLISQHRRENTFFEGLSGFPGSDAIQGRVEEGAGLHGLNNKNLEASLGRSIYIFAVH